jgi:TolB-like protein
MAAGVATLLNLAWSDPSNGVTGDAVDSIAVLPFENGAQDENAEYLSDGISESLINRLSQLSGLRVMSSNAVLRYKGKKPHAMEVAGELNVRAVLTGSVKQVGDQLVINVSLDDTKDNRRIWGENYSRKLTDVLAVQSEIAHEVASNLRLKLTGSDERQLTKRYTESVEAYQLYLKGNYHWKKYTREDSQKGIDYYNQAILVDPNYAMAYTGLANSYGVMALAFLPPEEGFSKAKYYAGKALELDETLSDAHSSMGAVRLFYDWDWVEAEKELTTALELDPDHFDANIVYPAFLESMGRFDESRPLAVGAQRREPLSAWTNTQLGIDLYLSRRYDASVAQLEKTISIEPRYLPAYLQLGQAYIQKKMYTRAIETFQKGIDQAGPDPHLIALRGHAYALAGELDNARQALDELNAMSKSAYVSSYFFAVVHAGTGDTDQTFEWLEKAYQERYFMLIRLKVEPLFDPLRSDARFHNLLKRMNFPG